MEFEVQAKSNNADDIDIFLPVERALDKAFEVAEQQKTVENCYVFIARKGSKPKDYPFQLHKWQDVNIAVLMNGGNKQLYDFFG